MANAPALHELQRAMAARILPAAESSDAALAAWLRVPPGVALAERLGVYVGGYPVRVHDALEEQFPAVAHTLGADAFAALTRRYAAAVALTSYNLNDAGAQLPGFLSHDELAQQFPFLPDLAALEWLVTRAFHAREQPPLDPASLADWSAEDWDGAVLRFQPAVAVVQSEWPILAIWNSRDTSIEVDRRDCLEYVLIHRSGFAVHCVALDAAQAEALTALCAGRGLGEVTNLLEARGADTSAVSTWFATWMQSGLIVSCTPGRA